MFADINEFQKEKEDYYAKINEIKANNTSIEGEENKLDKEIKAATDEYKDKIRRFLPTCLNIINNAFNTKYSIYKVGKDFDSSFNVIETNVKKTSEEIQAEMDYFKTTVTLDAATESQLSLVIEILTTYVAEVVDENKARILENSHVIGSSIINTTPVMLQKEASMGQPDIPASTFNPYANDPVNIYETENVNMQSEQSSNLDSSFSMQYNEAPVQTNDSVGMSIFGVNTGFTNDQSNVDESLVNNYTSNGTMDIFGVNNNNGQ